MILIFRSILKFSKQHLDQLLIIFTLLILFFDFAFFSPFTKNSGLLHSTPSTIAVLVLINAYYLYLLFSFFKQLINKKYIFKPGLVIVPILVFSTIRVFFFDVVPRWDSAVYFNALTQIVSSFDFTFEAFINLFNWFEHPTMGFALLTSITQFFQPSNTLGVNISGTILGILGIYSFYKICVYFTNEKNKTENLLITTLFAVNPLFIGVSTVYLPDFGVLVFFLTTIAAFIYNKLLLFLFFGTILVFTKETGVLSYGVFVFSYLLLVWFRQRQRFRKLRLPKFLILLTPLILELVYFWLKKWNFWSSGNDNKTFFWENGCQFCFGINSFNVMQNLSLFFVVSFNWILTLIILISVIKKAICHPRGFSTIKSRTKIDLFNALNYVFVAFVMFFMVYIIYIVPSYLVLSTALFVLLFYIHLRGLIISTHVRLAVLLVLIFLFFIQIFKTVDPVSKHIFGTYRFGDHEILKIGTGYLGDGMIYNTQFVYVDRLLAKFIKEFDITSDDYIYMNPYAWGEWYVGWGRFVGAKPKVLYDFDKTKDWPENMYFLTFPFEHFSERDEYRIRDGYLPPLVDAETILDQLKTRYFVNQTKKIQIHGYWIMVYKLTKK